jgi:HK97 family phage portal protein
MFKNFRNRIKNFLGGDNVFSSISVLPFSKYKKNYSKSDYLSAYEISLYANRAISKRAEKVSEIEFILKRGDKVIEDNKLLGLLYNPSKVFTGREFWALYQKYYDIFGEVYILLDKEMTMGGGNRINELQILRSDLVKPNFSEATGELINVEYRTGKGTKIFQADEIIYAHNPDPVAPLRGESLMRAGIRQIETSTQIDEYQNKVLENGGRVEGVFKFKSVLNKEQLEEIKDKYQEEYGNASRSGLPMFLGGEAEYDKMALTPAEMAYLETKKVTLNDIAILTGVPKSILGSTSDETYANADAAIAIFLRETINPLCKNLCEKLNQVLIPEDLELTFVDPTPENKEDKRKDLETANNINAMTTNEKREMLGLDPIKGGDDILVPMNLVPMGVDNSITPTKKKTITKSPACRQSDETKAQCVSRKIPEIMAEDPSMSQEQAVAIAESLCSKPCKTKSYHPLRNKEIRKAYHALQLKRLDRNSQLVLREVKKYFKGQEERILSKIRTQKSAVVKKELLGEVFTHSLEIRIAKDTILPILSELLNKAAKDSKEIAGSDWEFNETAEIQSWLDKKTDIFAKQINDTTFDKLKSEFEQSFSDGEGTDKLVDRIRETYDGISKGRATTIARTETHGVMQYGTIQGYKQAGLGLKIWVWAPGVKGGVREWHQAMDGEEKPIDTAFSNGLMFPGDPNGGAEEVISCECFI